MKKRFDLFYWTKGRIPNGTDRGTCNSDIRYYGSYFFRKSAEIVATRFQPNIGYEIKPTRREADKGE